MTGSSWTDEQISAFLDGELGEAETEKLAHEMEADEALSAHVERLRAANRVYVSAVAGIDRRPMPDAAQKILAAPPAAKVIRFRPRAVGAFVTEHRAIAASLLCAAAVWGVASILSPGPMLPDAGGLVVASSPLHRVLETAASSEPMQIAAGVTAIPRLTFASTDGGYCRQFAVSSSSGATSAIACREEGRWQMQVAVFGPPIPVGDYRTASGPVAPALEAFIDGRISGSPLNAAEEARLLSQGWRRSDR